jgi:hypothetical protein
MGNPFKIPRQHSPGLRGVQTILEGKIPFLKQAL